MAEEVRRWTVTYTKHVKQKRKVYQDGYLLLVSKKKVILYDENEKLLDSKFLKEDENLSSGETLTFGSHLVDIGDSDKAGLAREEISKKSSISDMNCTPGRQKISAVNVSPSRRIIREFRKNEKIKSVLQERSPTSTVSMAGEWQAMYTTHLTQKAKKYHDGFIKLILCGSQGRQAKLYDVSKELLSSRFLKKDEVISSNESLRFDGYLVDIGDSLNNDKLGNVKAEEKTCSTSEKHSTVGQNQFQQSSSKNGVCSLKRRKFSQTFVTAHKLLKSGNPPTDARKHEEQKMNSCSVDADRVAKTASSAPNRPLHSGNPPHEACPVKDLEPRLNSCGVDAGRVRLTESSAPNMSFRGANEILSFLKKPTSPRSALVSEQAPEKKCFSSPDLTILDTDYEIPEVKVAQYEGLMQNNSKSDEDAERRVKPFQILREIKIEKDSDDDVGAQLESSSAVVDLENTQPNELAFSEGISGSRGNSSTTNTQSGDAHQHCKTQKPDPRCSQVGEKPKTVNRALGIGHRFMMQSTKIKSSSTTMDECPSFDLGF